MISTFAPVRVCCRRVVVVVAVVAAGAYHCLIIRFDVEQIKRDNGAVCGVDETREDLYVG